MIAQLSHSDPLRQSVALEHRRQVGGILGEELRAAVFAPDVDLFEVEAGGPDEDARRRLLTLGLRMLSVMAAMVPSLS